MLKNNKLFMIILFLNFQSFAFASDHNLTSQALGSALGLFNLEYSYKICEHSTLGVMGSSGEAKLASLKMSGSSYGVIFRRYLEPALDKNSFYFVASYEHRKFDYTLEDFNKSYTGEMDKWVTSAGVGYQWFWKSFNIGFGVLATDQKPFDLKTQAQEVYKDQVNPTIGLDFTIGGKF